MFSDRKPTFSIHRYDCIIIGLAELTEVSGTGIEVLQNSQKFRKRALKSCRTHRSSGYGYGSLTELTEIPGRYVYESCPRTPGIVAGAYRTYKSSGTGMDVVHTQQKFSQKFRARVWKLYGTHRNSW